jgi:sorting nexin-25
MVKSFLFFLSCFFPLAHEVTRKIRDHFKILLSESRVLSYITLLRENLWPSGKLKPMELPRSAEEKIRTRDEANRKLSFLVPGM